MSTIVRTPVLRFVDDDADRGVLGDLHLRATLRKKMQPAENRNVSGVDPERPLDAERRGQQPRAARSRSAVDPNDAIDRKALAAASSSSERDLRDQALLGRIEELLHAGVDEDRDEQQAARC